MTKSTTMIATAATLAAASVSTTGPAPEHNTPNAYADVATVIWRYQDAVAQADQFALEKIMSPIWNSKRIEVPDGSLITETKEAGIARRRARGPIRGGSRDDERITSIQVFFDDFAMARTDDLKRATTTIYTLFKSDGIWQVVGEASTNAEAGMRQTRYNPHTAEADVLSVLNGYYSAVVDGDAAALDRIFHTDWHMKNHESGAIVSEDKSTFQARIRDKPLKTYADNRQIADVQIAWDRLAYVRIDSAGVTVFVFFRVGERWFIVDKAWSAAKT